MPLADLVAQFQPQSTLSSDSQLKQTVLLGQIDGQHAILMLEKTHFSHTAVESVVQIDHNDVYYWGTACEKKTAGDVPQVKLSLIFPATPAHIAKYQKHPTHIVVETPAKYQQAVVPYIETQRGERLQWVRNILFHGAEKDRFVCRTADYVLLPDMKWDGTTLESLYLVCIVTREDLASIRDLTKTDLPYLERIEASLLAEVSSRYPALAADRLRLYVHYQPSFYHFHIHVVNADYSGLGHTILAGKAILLAEVIETLRFVDYKDKTMVYEMNERHDLWDKFK